MIVEISRTSNYGSAPEEGAYQEHRLTTSYCNCKTLKEARAHKYVPQWFFREGTYNHREENGHAAMDSYGDVWLIDIPSLEWAAEKWGRIVVSKSDVVGIKWAVEVYDGYRE